jgi:hypothetical protein
MRGNSRIWLSSLACATVAGLLAGCGGSGGSSGLSLIGTPFLVGSSSTTRTGPGNTGSRPGSTGIAGARASIDPCTESQARKFIRISMRNLAQDDVHYFLVLVAFVNGSEHPDGAVCPTDRALYQQFGYTTTIDAGQNFQFGDYCITGPALIYFYQNGQFQGAGTQGLASAIAPAQGTSATYDTFFGPAGQQVPVPNWILFHNPGTTTEGRTLNVAQKPADPCAILISTSVPSVCQQDSFYYVDETDVRAGSTVLGSGSYVRVPTEIQGTGCQCGVGNLGYQQLAPSGTTAATALCNEFLRGGRIDYVFVRDDTDPPYPQLLWRVSDSGGARAHNFDPRAGIQ